MGVLSFTVSQLALTAVGIAALKRNGVLTVKPESIKNETLRTGFNQAVSVRE